MRRRSIIGKFRQIVRLSPGRRKRNGSLTVRVKAVRAHCQVNTEVNSLLTVKTLKRGNKRKRNHGLLM